MCASHKHVLHFHGLDLGGLPANRACVCMCECMCILFLNHCLRSNPRNYNNILKQLLNTKIIGTLLFSQNIVSIFVGRFLLFLTYEKFHRVTKKMEENERN